MQEIYTCKVENLTDRCYAFENLIIHNIKKLPNNTYLKLDDLTVYRAIKGDVLPNQVGIGLIQRLHHNLPKKKLVNLRFYKTKSGFIKKLSIKLSLRNTKKSIIVIHKEDFKDYIIKKLKKHYYYPNQKLVYLYKKVTLTGEIISNNEGFANNDTEIDLETSELNLNIVDSSLLNRELFNDKFDFEKIGIGGLNNELVNIFRRALSSRGIKDSIINKMGIKHVKGIILHGPPGTGKTLIARNIGKLLTNRKPVIINGPEILNKYVGEAERKLREIFEEAELEKQKIHNRLR